MLRTVAGGETVHARNRRRLIPSRPIRCVGWSRPISAARPWVCRRVSAPLVRTHAVGYFLMCLTIVMEKPVGEIIIADLDVPVSRPSLPSVPLKPRAASML